MSQPAKSTTPAQTLKAFRERQGLTQRDLGKIIGRTDAQIGAMENEHTPVPRWLLLLITLCNSGGITVAEFV